MAEFSKKSIVKGEAEESESEESDNENDKNNNPDYIQGKIVDGEAPESDDEIVSYLNLKLNMAIPEESLEASSPSRSNDTSDSLLLRKLYERNLDFWNHLNNLIQTTALSASKQLISAEQILVKSQTTLQSASTTIKKVNATTTQILEKYQVVLSSNFIPAIKLNQNE